MTMQRRSCVLGALLPLLGACGGGSANAASPAPSTPDTPTGPGLRAPLAALNFSPYLPGQNPNRDPRVTASQLSARLALVAPLARRIRTYGCTDGLEQAPALARAAGLQVTAGAWINADSANNERQLANLLAIGNAGQADLLVVGNETLYRRELSASAVQAYLQRTKVATPTLRVAYADTWRTWIAQPQLVAAVDVLLVNAYPYWEGVAIADAVPALDQALRSVRAMAAGKPVLISETGWPTAGNSIGAAVPSEDNAARYLREVMAWAQANQFDPPYWFNAFDEAWKTDDEGPQGAHWGLMTAEGSVKPAYAAVLAGLRRGG